MSFMPVIIGSMISLSPEIRECCFVCEFHVYMSSYLELWIFSRRLGE
jgi:hypothetical protein